jgi:hypothetical protein
MEPILFLIPTKPQRLFTPEFLGGVMANFNSKGIPIMFRMNKEPQKSYLASYLIAAIEKAVKIRPDQFLQYNYEGNVLNIEAETIAYQPKIAQPWGQDFDLGPPKLGYGWAISQGPPEILFSFKLVFYSELLEFSRNMPLFAYGQQIIIESIVQESVYLAEPIVVPTQQYTTTSILVTDIKNYPPCQSE